MTIVPSQEGDVVPAAVTSRLDAKLKTLMTRVGVVGAENSQFFVSGRFDTGYSERTSGPTPAEYVHTTLTLYIGDAEAQKIFSSLTLELKGVGASVEQAYTKALNSISFTRKDFKDFIRLGKEKIINYYDSHYPVLLEKAQTAVGKREYDEAQYYLTQIPECCEGFSLAQSLMTEVFALQQEYDGQQFLAQAQAEWAADPTDEGARKAFEYLTRIDPESSAYPASLELAEQMQTTVKADADRKYKDELALRQKEMDNQAELEKARINAARDVATAWARAHRPVVYHYWWF